MSLLKIKCLVLVLLCSSFVAAQVPDFANLPDGFYTDYVEVRGAKPGVNVSELKNKSGVSLKSFYPEDEQYYTQRGDELHPVNYASFFGIVRNGVFYWIYNEEFYRLGMKGMLSHVVVIESHYTVSNGMNSPSNTSEQKSMVIDFNSGHSFAFEPEPFGMFLLENAPDLYEEFILIKKNRDKKRALFVFLRRYNNRFKK
ncbi:MAG: hypothetical protein ACJAUV_000475 [Flavobacteriales bacterium]|jgi:hypothetical protein